PFRLLAATVAVGLRRAGAGAAGAVGHLRPERVELGWRHLLPWRTAAAGGAYEQQGLLPPAERLAHLHPGLRALGRVGAQLERAAVHAGGSRRRRDGRADGPPRVERGPGAGDARRQIGTVRALEAPLAFLGLVAPLRQAEQQQH